MTRYKLIAKARLIGHVQADNEEDALRKYEAGNYQRIDKPPVVAAILDDVTSIGRLLKEYREWNERTQEDIAKMLGVNKLTVIRWEHGRSRPSRLAVQKMKEAGIL